MFPNDERLRAEGAPSATRTTVMSALAVWLVSVIATPFVLAEWSDQWFIGLWVAVHSIAYWAYVLGPLGRPEPHWRSIRMASSIAVWGSVSVSALLSEQFAEHEPFVLLVAIAFTSLRAIVTTDDTRRVWEADGLVIGGIAAISSMVAGRPGLGIALLGGAAFFHLAERGQLALHAAARADRAALSAAMSKMTGLAFTDQLTGLGNRRAAVQWLESQPPGRGAVLLVDIDEFKVFNDRYGYQAGDDVLISAAAALQRLLGEHWHLFRLGGDEFVAFSEGVHGLPLPAQLQVVDATSVAFDGTPVKLQVSLSGGTSLLEFPIRLDAAMGLVSPALRTAKRARGSSIISSSTDMVDRDPWSFAMRALDALESGHFTWWGQPIIDLATGQPTAVELLCRWQGDDEVIATPTEFLGALSTFRRLRSLGRQNIRALGVWLDALDAAGLNHLTVHLNVPPSHIAGGLVRDLEELLDRSRWSRIAIEVLESEVLHVNAPVIEAINEVRSAGVTVLIDDFGAGHSSFRLLTELPFDGVKLDRALVAGADTHARRAAIVEGIAPVFAKLAIATVAEGVETPGEIKAMAGAGVGQAQGWHIAHPEPLADCVATLRVIADAASMHQATVA